MNRPCRSMLVPLFLSTTLGWCQDYAEEMVPPPLDLDIRGTSLLWAGSPQKQAVALTFDDGPVPGKTDAVLSILRENGIKATFFMVGERVQASPDLARQVALEGHDIGNHSQTHHNLTKLGSGEVIRELNRCQEAIAETLGFKPTLFRAPYGAANMTTLAALSHLSLSAVFWSIDTRDWKAQSEAEVQNSALKGIKNGDVILFHEHSRYTVGALPGIISAIREKGFAFETVSALFDRPQAAPTLLASASSPNQSLVAAAASPQEVEVAKVEAQPALESSVSLGGSELPLVPASPEPPVVSAPPVTAPEAPLVSTPEVTEAEIEVESPAPAIGKHEPDSAWEGPQPTRAEELGSRTIPDKSTELAVTTVQGPPQTEVEAPQGEMSQLGPVQKEVAPPSSEVEAPVLPQALVKEAATPPENQSAASSPVVVPPTGGVEIKQTKAMPPRGAAPKTGAPPKTSSAIAKSDKAAEGVGDSGRVRRLQPVARFKQRLVSPEPTEPPAGRVAQPRRLVPRVSAGAPMSVEANDSASGWGYASPTAGTPSP